MRMRRCISKLPKTVALILALGMIVLFYQQAGPDTQSIQGTVFEQTIAVFNKEVAKNMSLKRPNTVRLNKTVHPTPLLKIKPSNGEALAKALQSKCQALPTERKFVLAVTSNTEYNIMLCPMCKLASTFWTRFFVMLKSYKDPKIETPYDIAISDAPPTKERLLYEDGALSPDSYQNQYKFLFVRNPYSRILSAYVDKLFAPNPAFWRGVVKGVIRRPTPFRRRPLMQNCGSDLSFEEYVKAIVKRHTMKPAKSVDCHDSQFHSTCHTCSIKYDFVGKMENFVDDSAFLYKKLGLNKTINAIQKLSGLLDSDALYDTVSSAFAFKNDVITCIPWDDALRRVWRKLQIRGVIGKDQFPLTAQESDKIGKEEFIKLVKETRLKTPSAERKKQRKEALIEIYRSVPLDLLNQLQAVYSVDFEMFQYESSPDYTFNRSGNHTPFGYLTV